MISKRLLHLFYIETPQLGKIGTTPSTLHSPCDHHSTSHSPQRQSEVFKQSLLEYQKAHNCPRRLSHKVKSVHWSGKDTVPWRSWSIILPRNLRHFVLKKRHNCWTKNMQYVTQYVNVLSILYIKKSKSDYILKGPHHQVPANHFHGKSMAVNSGVQWLHQQRSISKMEICISKYQIVLGIRLRRRQQSWV